jgi:hypothetical protein
MTLEMKNAMRVGGESTSFISDISRISKQIIKPGQDCKMDIVQLVRRTPI